MKWHPLLALLLATLVTGCKASVNANVNASGKVGKDGKEVPDYDKPLSKAQLEQGEAGAQGPVQYALMGARHDLSYIGEPTEVCTCLAAAVGPPNDPRFSWEAAVPLVDNSSQVVVAMTSQSIACSKARATSLGASYQGYVIDGNNVVVIVEEAKPGRPLTSGGIVPRPAAEGGIYIRPAEKGLPFGKPLSAGERRCALSLAGPAQPGPQVPAEEIFKRPYKTKELKSADDAASAAHDGVGSNDVAGAIESAPGDESEPSQPIGEQ